MLRNLTVPAAALILILGSPVSAMAAEYEITIEMDEVTSGDLEMTEAFLENANQDSIPSSSLRRLMMGGVGEVTATVDARFDDLGDLVLDDGTLAVFFDDDVLRVRKKVCSKIRTDGQCGNAVITFACKIDPKLNSHRKCRPHRVSVRPEAGGCVTVPVPPGRSKGGVSVCQPGDPLCEKSCLIKEPPPK